MLFISKFLKVPNYEMLDWLVENTHMEYIKWTLSVPTLPKVIPKAAPIF